MKPMSTLKEIEWKLYDNRKNAIARVGLISLACWGIRPRFGKQWRWRCEVTMNLGSFRKSRRYGKYRKSIAKSKQEAEKIAKELIMDTREGLKETMNLFGLDED
jgi:hypothetical protein